jgi:hypothetical protein
MVTITDWLAYLYQWPEGRFSVEQAGVVGEGVGPLRAFLFPIGLGLGWVLGAIVLGGAFASLLLALLRTVMPRPSSASN